MLILKVVFMRFKQWCALLRDGWIVFLCLLSSAADFGGIDECLMPALVKGSPGGSLRLAWVRLGPSLSSCPEPSANYAQPKLTSQISFPQLLVHGILDTGGSAGPNNWESNLLAATLSLNCPEHLGLALTSTVVLNGLLCMADTAVMLIEGTEVLPLCISFMVVKRHWAIPGRNDKSLVSNFFLLAQLVTKKNAIWECRNSLKILSCKEQFVNQENKAKCRACPNGKPSQAVW